MLASTFLVFVQVCDVCPLVRAHCFSADAVADSFLLTLDLTESTVQFPLPVDLITVDLVEKYQQVHEKFSFHTDDEVEPRCASVLFIVNL